MPQYPRYAIYFVPSADGALYRFGAELLGYDVFTGQALPFIDGVEADIEGWKQLTVDPRKYGFHATLKAPITLAPGRTEGELAAGMQAFAQTPRVIPMIAPAVRAIGGFIAIVPDAPSPDLQQFAADCVTTFDDFRAPLTAEDRARRNIAALTDKQITHLDRWGYPYVFEEFRFHMTLTGSLSTERRAPVLNHLQKRFAALDLQSVAVDRIALLRQDDATSGFTVIEHWPLKQI
jgi:putative phosphonate metabolism protein